MLLTGLAGLGCLLWARTVIPTYQVALVFGLGYLLVALQEVPSSTNPWKYEISVPLAIVLLALASRAKSIAPTLARPVALQASQRRIRLFEASLGSACSRRFSCVWQRRPQSTGKGLVKLLAVLALVMVTLFALYSIGTSLLVEGYLGKENQQLSVQQIENSGSLLVGGRPEWAGTIRLMQEHPMGFGLGTLPSSQDVLAAKAGMRAIGTDTENGYVDNYMFGGHIRLHSIVADLWATFGVVGFSLGILHGWSR